MMMLFVVCFLFQYSPFIIQALWSLVELPPVALMNVVVAVVILGGVYNALAYTVLRAPVDGAIALVPVEVNENVSQGQSVVLLTSGSRPEVEIARSRMDRLEPAEGEAPADPPPGSHEPTPAGTDDVQSELASVLQQQSPGWNLDFSLDELQASLKATEAESLAAEKLNTSPPRVIYRDRPALLVSMDGIVCGVEV